MKKSNFVFLSALLMTVCLISFSSCSDDDDNTPPPVVSPIMGTWKVTAQKCEAEVKPASLKEAIEKYLKKETFGEKLPQATLALSEDGKYVSKSKPEGKEITEVRGTYEYKNDKLTLTPSKVQTRVAKENENELGLASPITFDVKLESSVLTLSQNYTVDAKEKLEDDAAWESMEIEKPEGFELVKSTNISTFNVAPQPR